MAGAWLGSITSSTTVTTPNILGIRITFS